LRSCAPLKKYGLGISPEANPIGVGYIRPPPFKFHIVTASGAVKPLTVAPQDQTGFPASYRSQPSLGFGRRGDSLARFPPVVQHERPPPAGVDIDGLINFCKKRPDISSDGFSKMGRLTQYRSNRPP